MGTFSIIFIVVSVISILIFILAVSLIFSPKFRGKMLSNQVKASRHMLKYSMDDLKEMQKELSDYAISTNKEIMEDNIDDLKDINEMKADIDKNYYKKVAHGIKEGLNDSIYCKHCGQVIDNDSSFCKYCGKEQ